MRYVTVSVAILLLFLPAAASAQDDRAPAVKAAGQAPQAPRPQQQLVSTRRRGSMVGYIESALVDTRVRVRFDGGKGIDVPDRAEFFYAKCGCYRDLHGDPAFDPDAPGPGPGIVSDMNYQQLYGMVEFAAGRRVSVFAELPLRWVKPQEFVPGTGEFSNTSGLGDINAGVKIALSEADTHAVTLQVKGFFPSGDALKGLGTDHISVEPAVLYYQQAGERVAVESQFGVWLPIDGSNGVPVDNETKFAGKVFFYGFGPSVVVYQNDALRLAPVVEFIGWRVLDGFQTPPAEAAGTNIVNLKIGGRIEGRGGNSFYFGWGKALTTAKWYDTMLRIEYRASF